MLHNAQADRVQVRDHAEDDAAVVREVLAGRRELFETLVCRYQRVLFNVALRMLGDADEANDAAQNTFVHAYEKLRTYDAHHRFFSWIYRILVNECLNARRARRVQGPIVDVPIATRGVQESLEAAERERQVQRAILALPHEYREVIVLRYFSDLDYDEIAAAVGVPAKTVKSRLYTARQRLAAMLVHA